MNLEKNTAKRSGFIDVYVRTDLCLYKKIYYHIGMRAVWALKNPKVRMS
jgi:hypothetical protein